MHKIILAIILLAFSSVSLHVISAADKQTVCHKGDEISIAGPAVPAHLGHGDTMGECGDGSTEPESDTMAAVVMMRCEAMVGNGVEVVSASSSPDLIGDIAVILPVPPPTGTEFDPDCAEVLAALLNAGYRLRSITNGSAQSGVENDENLHLYTDYLLIGTVPI